MSKEGSLQKQAIVDGNVTNDRVKELVKKIDSDIDLSDNKEWAELKQLVNPEPKKEEASEETPVESEESQPEEETVESLVDGNTKEELLALADDRDVEVSDSMTKAEIAEKILEKKE